MMSSSRKARFRLEMQVRSASGIFNFEYEEKTVLDEVAFAITKGQKVALVGESGSGKSTLIKILLGFLKYDRGQINVGGTELRDLCLDKLYDKIVYLSQDF